jgi:hypothetical protein
MNSFDKKLRDKLQDLPESGKEAAWAKLVANLPKPWYVKFLKDYSGWLSSAVLGGIVIYQQAEINNSPPPDKENKTQSTINQDTKQNKIDTIYLPYEKIVTQEKVVYVKEENFSDLKVESNSKLDGLAAKEERSETYIEPSFNGFDEKENETVFKANHDGNAEINTKSASAKVWGEKIPENAANKNQLENKLDKERIAMTEETKAPKTVEQDVAKHIELKQELNSNSISDVQSNNTKIEEPNTLNQHTSDDLGIKAKNADEKKEVAKTEKTNEATESTARETSQSPKTKVEGSEISKESEATKSAEEAVKDKKQAEDEKAAEVKNTVVDPLGVNTNADSKALKKLLKDFNGRVGLEYGTFYRSRTSFGPTAEFFLLKNFSFNTGVIFSKEQNRLFKQPIEFNKGTGKRFEELYRPKLRQDLNQEIRNIKIVSSSVQTPVQFNFYYPVAKQLSLMVNSGLLLNLKNRDRVFYETKIGPSDVYLERFEDKRKSDVLAGATFGMGMQYQYKNIYASLNPTFSYPFERSFFLNDKASVGLNFALKYGLRK